MSDSILSGELNQRVTLQRSTSYRSSTNQAIYTWADVGTYYASVEVLGGDEPFNADQVQALADYRLKIRQQGVEFTTKDRFLWGTLVLNIKARIPAGRRLKEYWIVDCKSDPT